MVVGNSLAHSLGSDLCRCQWLPLAGILTEEETSMINNKIALLLGFITLALFVVMQQSDFIADAGQQPRIEARKTPTLTLGKLKFRDLNKNGKLDRYEDWRQPVDARVADL